MSWLKGCGEREGVEELQSVYVFGGFGLFSRDASSDFGISSFAPFLSSQNANLPCSGCRLQLGSVLYRKDSRCSQGRLAHSVAQ